METKRKGLFQKFLDMVEKTGNKLPHPVTLFAGLAVLVLVLSWIISLFGLTVEHPGKPGEIVEVKNLLSGECIEYRFTLMTSNLVRFAAFGVLLLTMLGIGIADGSGLISALLRGFVMSVLKRLITAGLVFAGVMSSVASGAGYV